jgi:signal peptidase I
LANKKSKLREYFEAIIIAIILALLIRSFAVQAFKIPSGSMIQTLLIGDQILVNKFIYGVKIPFKDDRFLVIRQPKRGDIIVFSFPGNQKIEECTSFTSNVKKRFQNAWNNRQLSYLFTDDCRDFIKRVIGVGGDKLEIKNKTVYVNDVALVEPYAIFSSRNPEDSALNQRDNFGPVIVPRNNFFVMGDNRDNSHDSRFWGYVDMSEIKGEAFIIYYSCKENDSCLLKLKPWEIRWSRIGSLVK